LEDVEIVEIIRRIVENEIKKLHIAEIGEVKNVYPHSSEIDKNNYECDVKLKYRELELRRVPVAAQQIGLANIPHVGDLVLVTFINGNINAPVMIGRLYTDQERPPVSNEEEIVYIPPYSEDTNLRRIHIELPGGMVLQVKDDVATIEANRTMLTLKRDGNVEIHSRATVKISGGEIDLSANTIKMKGKKSIEVESEDSFSLTAATDAGIQAGNNFSLESGAKAEVTAGSELSLASGGTSKVQSSAPLSIESPASVSVSSGAVLAIKGMLVKVN